MKSVEQKAKERGLRRVTLHNPKDSEIKLYIGKGDSGQPEYFNNSLRRLNIRRRSLSDAIFNVLLPLSMATELAVIEENCSDGVYVTEFIFRKVSSTLIKMADQIDAALGGELVLDIPAWPECKNYSDHVVFGATVTPTNTSGKEANRS